MIDEASFFEVFSQVSRLSELFARVASGQELCQSFGQDEFGGQEGQDHPLEFGNVESQVVEKGTVAGIFVELLVPGMLLGLPMYRHVQMLDGPCTD